MNDPNTSIARPPILVLSTGRCGSTMISELLSQHPKVLSLSEFFVPLGMAAFSTSKPTGEKMWSVLTKQAPSLNQMLKDGIVVDEGLYDFDRAGARFTPSNIPPIMAVTLPHLTSDPEALLDRLAPIMRSRPKILLADQYRFFFETLMADLGRELWVERSGGSLMIAAKLMRLFPEAKIIHVFRDGRDTAMSMQKHHNFKVLVEFLQRAKRLGMDPQKAFLQSTVHPLMPWFVDRIFMTINTPRLIAEDTPLEAFGALWNDMILTAQRLFKGLPKDSFLALRFEDVQNDPHTQLGQLMNFLGPGMEDESWLEAAVQVPRPAKSKFQSLPESTRAKLTEACAPGLEAMGYSTPI